MLTIKYSFTDPLSEECKCPCHIGQALHVKPCTCAECIYCKRNIKLNHYREHLDLCSKNKLGPVV